jgi:adenine phosphoribosyltransferase
MTGDDGALTEAIREVIRDVPDFPRAGIMFRDITPVFGAIHLPLRIASWMAAAFAADAADHRIDAVACVEARGFMLGPLVARELGVGLIPVRKPDKLPRETLRQDYDLEYGTDSLEMHADACGPGQRVLLVDDVLATGGTATAACRLIERTGASVAGAAFLIELDGLDGARRLPAPSRSLLVLPA